MPHCSLLHLPIVVPSLRALMIVTGIWLVGAAAFVASLVGNVWQTSPMLGLVRGLLFIGLAVALSALGAAWASWLAHGRGRTGLQLNDEQSIDPHSAISSPAELASNQ